MKPQQLTDSMHHQSSKYVNSPIKILLTLSCCVCVFELRRNLQVRIETSLVFVDHGSIMSRSNVLLFHL